MMVATALATTDQSVFQAMDRLDDEQIVAELQGAMLQEYVYEFQSGGKTIRGLSKSGTDDAARHMALKGEVLREEDVVLEWQDADAAYFKATVARYAVKNDGTEVKLDQVIGQKRQGKTAYGKPNEFWYEQGGQKALRNAKQKLIPESIKQQLIASYVEGGKVRRVDSQAPAPPQQQSVWDKGQPRPADVQPPTPPISDARQQLIADFQTAARLASQRGIEVKKVKDNISNEDLKTLTAHLEASVKDWDNAAKAKYDPTEIERQVIAEFEKDKAELERVAEVARNEPF